MISPHAGRPGRLAVAVIAAAAAVGTGCTASQPAPPASAPTTAGPTATTGSTAAAGQPDFATVERISVPLFRQQPLCPVAVWNQNRTGVDAKFGAPKFFRQLDCYASQDQVSGGLPQRGQQSIYVEFADQAAADRYRREGEPRLRPHLASGTVTVLVGSGLPGLDARGYLDAIRQACGCGEVRTGS